MRNLVAVAVLAGCVLDVDREVLEPGPASRVEIKDYPLPYQPALDLLFVVDSAPTMAGEQDALRINAPVIADVLHQIEGGLPDLHIGVVDADLGTLGVDVDDPRCTGTGGGGRLTTSGCGVAGAYLADERGAWGERTRNYQGTLRDELACMLRSVGANGCPWRQPLEAMRRGLDDGRQTGFLRDSAYLVVIFLGDADDCSAASPALYAPSGSDGPRDPFRCFAHGVVCDGVDDPYAIGPRTACRPRVGDPVLRSLDDYEAGLRALKRDWRQIVLAAITPSGDIRVEPGPRLADSCGSGTIAGTPAVRLRALLERFPERNVDTSVCDNRWTDVLEPVASLVARKPASAADDVQRVHEHLTTVEAELRAADVSRLMPAQRAARDANLDELHRYREARRYPRNHGEPGRVPIFIDHSGTRCAMADLIDHAGGAALVDRVAATRNTAHVPELAGEPELVAWLDRNGLTLGEAARIQPGYDHIHPCIGGQPVDRDPDAPGLQPDISASLYDPTGNAAGERVLPACGHELPCYRAELDPMNCTWGSGVALRVDPPYLGYPAWLRAQILIE